MDISVVIPAYNEGENLVDVVEECVSVLAAHGGPFEVLVIDDGSNDDTREVLAKLGAEHDAVRSLRLRRNLGKSAALSVGLAAATGHEVVLMDADGQDDPHEIPALLARLDGGLDLVTGRRAVRHDRFVKRQTSRLYNWVTAQVTGVEGRDFNSGLKAMTSDVAHSISLYGELHRYIPVLAAWAGFRVGEVDVTHRQRLHGQSKFGRSRFWRGLLDLITVRFLTTYTRRPFHLFGGLGLLTGALGTGLLVWMLISKVSGQSVGDRPALTTGVLLVVVGVQLALFGLLAELIVHQRSERDPGDFVVRDQSP